MHLQSILIGNVYRHPQDKSFYQKFRNVLEGIWEKRRNIIIVGDFNSDLNRKRGENEGCSPREELLNVLNSFNLRNVITEPTIIAENSETLIDLCIVNDVQKVNLSGVLHLGISDHSLIYASYKIKKAKKPPTIRAVKTSKEQIKKNSTKNEAKPHGQFALCLMTSMNAWLPGSICTRT